MNSRSWVVLATLVVLACAATPTGPGQLLCELSDFRAHEVAGADTVQLGSVFTGRLWLGLTTGQSEAVATVVSPEGVTVARTLNGAEAPPAAISYKGTYRAVQTTRGDSVQFVFADRDGAPTWMEWGTWHRTANDLTAVWLLQDSAAALTLAVQTRFRCTP